MDEVREVVQVDGGIVVGHDGSKCAQEALQWAGRLARRADLDLHVVRSWAMMTAPKPSTWEPGYVPPLADWEKAVLDELTRTSPAAGLDPAVRVTCHVVHKSAGPGADDRRRGGEPARPRRPRPRRLRAGCCSAR